MDALLVAINAKYIHMNNAVRLLKVNSVFDVDFIEITIHDDIDAICETIIRKKPRVIGLSVYIWNVEMIKPLCEKLKQMADIPIILGGPEVTYDAEYFLKHYPVDIIVKGEGEMVLDQVLDALINDKPLDSIRGIAFITKAGLHETTSYEIADLSKLKSPHGLKEDIKTLSQKINYLESSRGCPYKCSYCLSSLEKTVRFFPLETVKRNLLTLIEHGAKTIKFLDRTFNASKDAVAIIDFIIKHHKADNRFQFEMTGDVLDASLVDYIHAHAPKNLFRFEIGIQSTNDKTNQLVDRRQDNTRLFYLIKKINEAGIIDLHLDLIAGLPKEDIVSFKETFNRVYRLGGKELQLGFLKMLRGTKIRREATRFGYKFNDKAPYEIIENNVLSKTDIRLIKSVESMLNIYHNKGHFGSLVHEIACTYFNPFDFFSALHAFIHTNVTALQTLQLDQRFGLLDAFLYKHKLPDNVHDKLKYHYLFIAKVKPKCYFETVSDKKIKKRVFEALAQRETIPIHELYKHTILTKIRDGYLVAYYKAMRVSLYKEK